MLQCSACSRFDLTYATKPREIVERMKREQTTHLGKDLMDGQD